MNKQEQIETLEKLISANLKKAKDTAIGRVQGTKQAEAEYSLPKIESDTEYTISAIDDILNIKNLGSYVGNIQGRLPDASSQGRVDFINKLKLVKGKLFVAAFESLKGGGQITEFESKSAADGIAVLETTTSDAEFIKALTTLREIIVDLSKRARKRTTPRAPDMEIQRYKDQVKLPPNERYPLGLLDVK